MERSEVICILGKMKSTLTKSKPSWYESASAEDKAKFDEWTKQKVEALDTAIDIIRAEDRLLRLQAMSHEISGFIDKLIAGESDNDKQD